MVSPLSPPRVYGCLVLLIVNAMLKGDRKVMENIKSWFVDMLKCGVREWNDLGLLRLVID